MEFDREDLLVISSALTNQVVAMEGLLKQKEAKLEGKYSDFVKDEIREEIVNLREARSNHMNLGLRVIEHLKEIS